MSVVELEKRIAALEKKVDSLVANPIKPQSSQRWLEQAGQFAGDANYLEIVRRGRAYRESLRPEAKARQVNIFDTSIVSILDYPQGNE